MSDAVKRARDLLESASQPRPWTVREDSIGPDRLRCMVIDRDGMWVADCGDDLEHSALIAAAPDLLRELCEEVEAQQRVLRDLHNTVLGSDDILSKVDALQKQLTATRAALRDACEIGLDATTIWEDNDADIAARTRLHAFAKLAEEP